MESAAARVRPLLPNDDPVYVPTVMKALSYLLREREGIGAHRPSSHAPPTGAAGHEVPLQCAQRSAGPAPRPHFLISGA